MSNGRVQSNKPRRPTSGPQGASSACARKEATRDGVPPIELVDGEKLVRMFERVELGLRPRRTYELDAAFFDDYRK